MLVYVKDREVRNTETSAFLDHFFLQANYPIQGRYICHQIFPKVLSKASYFLRLVELSAF